MGKDKNLNIDSSTTNMTINKQRDNKIRNADSNFRKSYQSSKESYDNNPFQQFQNLNQEMKIGVTLDQYFGSNFNVVEPQYNICEEFGSKIVNQDNEDDKIQKYLCEEFEINEDDEDQYTESNFEEGREASFLASRKSNRQKNIMKEQDISIKQITENDEIKQKIIDKYSKKGNQNNIIYKQNFKFDEVNKQFHKEQQGIQYLNSYRSQQGSQNNQQYRINRLQNNNGYRQLVHQSLNNNNSQRCSQESPKYQQNSFQFSDFDDDLMLRPSKGNSNREQRKYETFYKSNEQPEKLVQNHLLAKPILNQSQSNFLKNICKDGKTPKSEDNFDNHIAFRNTSNIIFSRNPNETKLKTQNSQANLRQNIQEKYSIIKQNIDKKLQYDDQQFLKKYANKFNFNLDEYSKLMKHQDQKKEIQNFKSQIQL